MVQLLLVILFWCVVGLFFVVPEHHWGKLIITLISIGFLGALGFGLAILIF